MRKTRNAPSRIKYHLSPMYDHLTAAGHRCTRLSKRSSHAILIAILALVGVDAFAQGTPAPYTVPQYFDANGNPLANGGICTFEAGTTTLATTYTTSALTVAQANPIPLNAAGRPTASGATVGIWLSPGRSYKLVLKDATVTTCSPDTGVTLWSIDNVQAVPGASGSVDTTGLAGEAILAGEVVYLSAGDGALNAGQWYKADADLSYKSTGTFRIGVAPSAIASGATGTIRLSGAVTVAGPLSTGLPYYVSATAGAMVTTPPANAIRIGQAQSATVLVVGYTKAPVSPRGPPCGRLTLTTGLPVTISDVTAATTVYYTPAGNCNGIALYDGTQWNDYAFAELSIAVPATTSTLYDVFAYDNGGVVALELTAWTNDTTRATALVLQDGVYVKTGALTRRYLGQFRTTGVSGQTEDSVAKRYVCNQYNKVASPMYVLEATNTWTYTTAAYRQANAAAANQLDFLVCGVGGDAIEATLHAIFSNDNASVFANAAIGLDSTTTPATGLTIERTRTTGANTPVILEASLRSIPAAGRHTLVWLEYSDAGVGTTTWYGDNNTPTLMQTGIQGMFVR